MTLKDLLLQFPDETACKDYLKAKRWPDGVRCPKCGSAVPRLGQNGLS